MVMTALDASTGTPSASSEVLLATEGLGKQFGGFHALRDVTVDVHQQQILGVIGPNGAGKTTLFNLLAGAFRPTAGRVSLRGQDITRLPPHRRVRRGIGRTFQLIQPFVSMTVRENVETAAMAAGLRGSAARDHAEAMIEQLGLTPIAGKSGGNVNAVEGKRLEVARALATRPQVILLDEIFSGLNSDEVDELVGLVKELRSTGLTVLVIEHNVRAIRAVADRVVAIVAGRLVSDGTPDHVLSDPHVIESYLGQHASA
jgi:branched-chain amino acid transport system ATP-binding protein